MKALLTLFFLSSFVMYSQYEYEPSEKNQFGLPNPSAPEQIKDYEPMIGLCDCKSIARNPDGSWAEPINMTWRFKYIMNGMAVQDETLKADGGHSGSIRQYNTDSSKWYVHYYSTKGIPNKLSTWEGGTKGDKLILYKEQKDPRGNDGFYRLTFYDISQLGYKWIGEWVNKEESIVYPTWRIDCAKRTL